MVNVECQFEYDDEVFDVRYGWGRIDHFERVVNEETGKVYYNAKVKFKSTKNYIYYDDSSVRTLLSHRAYESFDEVVSIDWDKRIGRWSKILVAVFYFDENCDCETLYLNDEFDWEDEQEVYTKLEEEKDEPKILDFDNIKWGVLTGVLLSIIVGFLILLPFSTPKDNWITLCIFLFFGICYTLGSVYESVGGV
jgi:hypothetical protein